MPNPTITTCTTHTYDRDTPVFDHFVSDVRVYSDFLHDEEKMRDFYKLSKEEFLASYSYLDEREYDLTLRKVMALGEDRFNIENGYVHWVYHNPDAISGDQFVENIISADLLCRAVAQGTSVEDVFDYLGSECRQFCYDYDPKSYNDEDALFVDAYRWAESEFFAGAYAVGCTRDTLIKLIKFLDNAGYKMAPAYQMVYTLPERSE